MNPRESALDLMERYVYRIGEQLPRAQRDDVKAELRSLLSEQLEERTAAGESPDAAAVSLITAFGRPQAVAARYSPAKQYLIGPRLYPYFLITAQFAFYFVAGFFLFWTLFGVMTGSTRLPEFMRPDSLLAWGGELLRLLAVNLALLVCVFALLERLIGTLPEPQEQPKQWDPRELPPVPTDANGEKVSEPGLIGKIYAVAALAVLLNFYPQWFGILIFTRNEMHAIPYPALGIYLPVYLLNVWWAGSIALNVWLLIQRHWTRETRWLQLVLNVFGAVILFMVISASSFQIDVDWVAAQQTLVPERLLAALNRGVPRFGNIFRLVLSLMLVATVIEAVTRLVRVLRRYAVS